MGDSDFSWYLPQKGMISSKKFTYGMNREGLLLKRDSQERYISFDEIQSASILSPELSIDVISSLQGPDLSNLRVAGTQLGETTFFLSVPLRAIYKNVGAGSTTAFKPKKDTKTIYIKLKNDGFLIISPMEVGGFFAALGSRRVSLVPLNKGDLNIKPMAESEEWVNQYSRLSPMRKKIMFISLLSFFLLLGGVMAFMFYSGEIPMEGIPAEEKGPEETFETPNPKSSSVQSEDEVEDNPLKKLYKGLSVDLPAIWLDDHTFAFAIPLEGEAKDVQEGKVTGDIITRGTSLVVDYLMISGDVSVEIEEAELLKSHLFGFIHSMTRVLLKETNNWTGEASLMYIISSSHLRRDLISIINNFHTD